MAAMDNYDPVTDLPNPNAGRYLRAILMAVGGPDDEVRPSVIADRLEVTPASVTEMTQRLSADGFVDHKPYGGIRLTSKGDAMARHLQWRQCVLRRFFSAYFDVEIPPQSGYQASFALPVSALDRLREAVDLNCRDLCDERVWSADCEACDPEEDMSVTRTWPKDEEQNEAFGCDDPDCWSTD